MRKNVGDSVNTNAPELSESWLDLETIAQAEVTSEAPDHPIEFAFQPTAESQWRAARKGQQTVRLYFDQAITIKRILLQFVELQQERTHEFTLSWAPNPHGPYHLIVRQQWTFNPQNATEELEDYRVDLRDVRALELVIRPDLGRGQAWASITRWAVA
jgi:hypothetical protein